MMDPHFFGYGSLVNRATQSYPDVVAARLRGWRRVWCQTTLRDVAFLSVIPDSSVEIDGLIARVPGADWAALDERERAYDRHEVTALTDHSGPVQVYAVSPGNLQAGEARPQLLLSYIDVVVQGYLREFGERGVADFFATTQGWDAAIVDDRAAPIYSRHQVLSAEETVLVDDWLARVGSVRSMAVG